MLIQKSKVKKLINSQGLRMSPDALDGINRAVESLIISLCGNVTEDGMKTMMTQHTNAKGESNDERKCQKCCNIKPEFLKLARSTQVWCHEEATLLFNRLKKDPDSRSYR